ncbi:hypothetical protein E8E15_002904 [Penicillium rubens]|nr:hypothetical protein E8E15_002904 [Penicillium rubens]
MKALSHNYLIWLAVFSLHAPVINTNISPYFRSKEYSEATLGAWPHQAYRSSPAVVPLLNIQKDHPTCHDNKDHLLLMAPRGTEVSNPGPMILDTYGGLVWNEPVRYGKTWAVDVRFLDDEPYISLWASKDPASEVGHWYMASALSPSRAAMSLNSRYDEVYQVRSGDGWTAEDHDFVITPMETAFWW